MSKRTVIIVLFILGLIFFLILIQKDSDYVVTKVTDGNTLVLESGTIVRLIGVSSTNESKEYLDNFIGKPVNLRSDRSAHFDPRSISSGDLVYAYVFGGENSSVHLNAQLLRDGKSELMEETYLNDSLEAFRKYAELGRSNRQIDPTPTPVEPIVYKDDDIILPDPPSPEKKKERRHSAWYTDGNMNLDMLDEACDYTCPYTKQFANSLAGRSQGPFNAGQICEIFDYCYNNWKYVNDPKGCEYLAMASESIEGNLCGDCDDFAILMAACILAIGGDACVNTGQGPEGGHAFTEVDISRIGETQMLNSIQSHFAQYNVQSLNTRQDGPHLWLNLDWQAAYPGGRYFNSAYSRDAYPCVNGQWKWEKL